MKRLLFILLSCTILILSSCAESQGIPSPTHQLQDDDEDSNPETGDSYPTYSTNARARKTIAVTQTPRGYTSTPTTRPSRTPTPQNTPFPTIELPDRELSEDGPWLLIYTGSLLYVLNSDGTGKTLLIDRPVELYSVSPSGRKIAYVTDADPESYTTGLQLRIITIPNGQDQLITNLQDSSFFQSEDPEGFDPFQAMRAITISRPRWSHNGKYIAFIGQHLGPTADLYVYDVELEIISHLTDGPSQAYRPSWSPDDYFIFHSGAWSFGTGGGLSDAGSWVVSRDGMEMIETTTGMGSDHLIAWQNSERFLIGTWSQPCGLGFLQSYRITTGETTDIWPYYLSDLAYDSSTGKLVITVPIDYDFCMSGNQPTGLYIIDEFGAEPRLIPDMEVEGVYTDPPHQGSFILSGSQGTYRLHPDDTVVMIQDAPAHHQEYSKQDGLWLWFGSYKDESGLWIGDYYEEPRRIFDRPVSDASWSPNGDAIFLISKDDGLLYFASGPEFSPFIIDVDTNFGERSYLNWIEN